MEIRIKRVYEPAEAADGTRVLVDRLWPRGVSKAAARLDRWEKEVAPSAELRTSWHADPEAHDPAHFRAFARAYRAELEAGPAHEALVDLAGLARDSSTLTLLYAVKDERLSHAPILRDALLELLGS
ncbi:MAG: DUF488 family protein [Leucobacter sp.]|nr:DUF488 family protein [Leucobacter sp.]